MQITGSPDITSLEVQVTWDISGVLPNISLVNLSTGSGLANMLWWFVAYSPTNTPIHVGDVNNIDINGAWNSYVITDSWPKPFHSIEWSGAPYTFTVYAKDTQGNIYSISKSATICHTNGNTQLSKNPYGLGKVYLRLLCEQAGVYFEDQTYTTWKGLTGTRISSTLKVAYPIDESGSVLPPFELTNFSNVIVPITFSSENYQFISTSIYDYDFTNYVHVRVKYLQSARFPVLCNIDLCPLACEIAKLIDSVENGTCGDATEANRKLGLINSKFALIVMGKFEPLCGVDVPKLINEIQEIGGFECDCCNTPTGIIGNGAAVIDGYTFDIVHVGGDVNGTVTQLGNNIQFNLYDKSYVFAMYPGSPMDTTAFTISTATTGYTKTYYLNVSAIQLAEDLGNAILGNANLVNLWRSILENNAQTMLSVDGECIFQSTSTCNYDFVLNNVPADTTYALLSGIQIDSVVNQLSFSFNLTNLPQLQAYLNALGYGVFAVTAPFPNPGNDIYIASTANPNNIQSITFKISSTTYIADMVKDCTGYVAISADEVVQRIITYICNIKDTQVATSQDYIITYVDISGDLQYVTVDSGSSISDLIQNLLDLGNTSITYLQQNAGAVSCDALQAIFTTNTSLPTSTDYFFATKGNGACSKVSYLEAFNYMLNSGFSNATTKAAFCSFVNSCGSGLTCEPYDYLQIFVTNYSTTCTSAVGIEYSLS